jgi:L,D-transpeptidase YcbB
VATSDSWQFQAQVLTFRAGAGMSLIKAGEAKAQECQQRLAMGFGLSGFQTVKRVSAALMLATALAVTPIVMSATGQAESNESEENRLNTLKKSGRLGVASDLRAASKVSTKTEIVSGKNVSPMLSESSASQMAGIAARYESIVASGGFPKVPGGTYKKGSKGAGVAALNQRLFQDGYLRKEATQADFASVFTTATQEAVSRFQRNMGLNPSGKVDGATLAQLNVSAEARLRTIVSNVSRLQTYGQNLGGRYLVVNVPGQQLETVANGKVFSRHNVIVGRPERPTPVVMTALENVSFNPYWNAPVSIVEKDILPKLQSGTNILEDLNIKVFDGFGGPEVDPSTVDWGSVTPDQYFFREEPGPKSAMATAKINFPSPFGIYLHDTPEKQLFSSSTRYYSSGCVRVEAMPMLVQWVLNGQEGIGAPEISALAETLEQRIVKMSEPPQLRVTYLTAWPVGNTVAFRNDVYGLDGTGFVTGQPMPVGELSDDGQRFVLKPVPRKAAAVEAAEAEGFTIFSGTKKSAKKAKLAPDEAVPAAPLASKKKQKSVLPEVIVESTPKKTKAASVFASTTSDKKTDKTSAKKKNYTGLFDWAAYRKEQKLGGKATTVAKKPKKKIITAASATEVTPPTPKLKPADKKSVALAATPKPTTAPKPTVKPKVIAANCKPDATGKLPANCKAAAN